MIILVLWKRNLAQTSKWFSQAVELVSSRARLKSQEHTIFKGTLQDAE